MTLPVGAAVPPSGGTRPGDAAHQGWADPVVRVVYGPRGHSVGEAAQVYAEVAATAGLTPAQLLPVAGAMYKWLPRWQPLGEVGRLAVAALLDQPGCTDAVVARLLLGCAGAHLPPQSGPLVAAVVDQLAGRDHPAALAWVLWPLVVPPPVRDREGGLEDLIADVRELPAPAWPVARALAPGWLGSVTALLAAAEAVAASA